MVVVHAISLPPGEFGGGYIEQLFQNRLDPRGHPYFRETAGLRVSSHLLIDRHGSITQFVSVYDRAWHCGESCFQNRPACNDYSIGIELEGCDEQEFTARQYLMLAELIGECRAVFPAITSARIVGHADIAPRRKTDPGPLFDWDRLFHTMRHAPASD